MTRALAQHADMDENHLAHRLMGDWDPEKLSFHELVIEESPEDQLSKPYPFYLAYALDQEPEELGDINEWIAERKWDGIRGQIIQRENELYVWSRGEELMTDRFPEFDILKELLPKGTVIDGEIIRVDMSRNLGTQQNPPAQSEQTTRDQTKTEQTKSGV